MERIGPLLAISRVIAGTTPIPVSATEAPPVCRCRGTVLDAQFDRPSGSSLRLHLYWEAGTERQVDLEVLSSTVDPVSRLEVLSWTQHRESEVLVPVPHRGGGWVDMRVAARLGAEWLVVPRDRNATAMCLGDGSPRQQQELVVFPRFREPLVLCRPRGKDWSYAEMAHPEDCVRIIARMRQNGLDVSFGLFGVYLEKGVVLRSRLRGAFLPRRDDTRLALRLFHRFRREPPRLSV